MSFSSPEALLSQVGWPADALNRRGALSWSKMLSEDPAEPLNTTVASAAVLVNNETITLRYRTATLGGKVSPQLEAKWSIAQEGSPVLLSHSELGQKVDLNEDAAISAFQRRLLLMATRPSFEPMAPRRAPAPTVSARPGTGL